MVKAVLFDMDGVLVDSFEAWARLVDATARHFGCPPVDREQFRATYGHSTEEDVRAFFPGQTAERVDAYYGAHFAVYASYVQTVPGAKEVLAALKRRDIPTAVVTNTASPLAGEILASCGLEVDVVVSGSDVAQGKPAPDMVLRACELLGVSPTEALVVGDSAFDRNAAEAAGARFVGFGVEADEAVAELSDVLTLVDR